MNTTKEQKTSNRRQKRGKMMNLIEKLKKEDRQQNKKDGWKLCGGYLHKGGFGYGQQKAKRARTQLVKLQRHNGGVIGWYSKLNK